MKKILLLALVSIVALTATAPVLALGPVDLDAELALNSTISWITIVAGGLTFGIVFLTKVNELFDNDGNNDINVSRINKAQTKLNGFKNSGKKFKETMKKAKPLFTIMWW